MYQHTEILHTFMPSFVHLGTFIVISLMGNIHVSLGYTKTLSPEISTVLHWLAPDVHIFDTDPSLLPTHWHPCINTIMYQYTVILTTQHNIPTHHYLGIHNIIYQHTVILVYNIVIYQHIFSLAYTTSYTNTLSSLNTQHHVPINCHSGI